MADNVRITAINRNPNGSIEVTHTVNGASFGAVFNAVNNMEDNANMASDDDHYLTLLLAVWQARFGFNANKDDDMIGVHINVDWGALLNAVTIIKDIL